MAETWTVRRERGSPFAIAVLAWIARRLGRGAARGVLHGVTGYYLLAAPAARRASKRYLRRVLGRAPRWRDIYRHIYTFAVVGLDRMYSSGAEAEHLAINIHGGEIIRDYCRRGHGVIIIAAHLGSFDILRATGGARTGTRLRVLMDRTHGAKANAALDMVNPRLKRHVIDTSEADVDRVLKVKAALDRGEMVGLMADRYQDGERTADCHFLGGEAPLPLTPWLLAGLTGTPVVLAFGLYRGGNHYDLYYEAFSDGLDLPRGQRHERAAAAAQAYADRLAVHVRAAPYNWFNFYDFWHKAPP
jgi:predicted LPLAT superfamily acyltransferase